MTHWVTGYGTGGTFHGAGKALKASIPDLKIVLAEPEAAGLLASGVATERNADGSPKVESCVEINQRVRLLFHAHRADATTEKISRRWHGAPEI